MEDFVDILDSFVSVSKVEDLVSASALLLFYKRKLSAREDPTAAAVERTRKSGE